MNKELKKGLIYGVLSTVAALTIGNTGHMVYKNHFAENIDYNRKAAAIYSLMEENYIGDIDEAELYEGIYTGMFYKSTDQYSTYISAKDFEDYKIRTSGNYVGVGIIMSIDSDDYSIVTKVVYEQSPAYKSGIRPGDKLIMVEGTPVNYENYGEAIDMIRGKEGTEVNLKLYRPAENNTYEVTVVRESVKQPTVATALIDDVGYMKISGFEEVTFDQYKEALNNLRAKNINSLIIDLRDNPGGLLDQVTLIADDIIPEGVITYTENKAGKREYINSDANQVDIPIVVLVNEHSASASELLSAAIKDTKKGIIVGKNTYGKGVVQTTFPFVDGSAVKMTTAKYFTPNGICIDGEGIKPDVEVDNPVDYELPVVSGTTIEYNLDFDSQLNKAISILKDN